MIYERKAGRGNLVARLPATKTSDRKPILLLSHIDTVPFDADLWSFAPLSGEVHQGYLQGRGALDDKGHGVVHALALVLLAQHVALRNQEIVFCASAAEETDREGIGIDWLLERHPASIGPPAWVWNEGGVSTHAAFLGGQLVHAIGTAEKRSLWIRLRAEGPGGHGSVPVPESAIHILMAALERIEARSIHWRVTTPVKEMFTRIASQQSQPWRWLLNQIDQPWILRLANSRLREDPSIAAMFHDSISITGLQAGIKANVIPRYAEATLDIRLLPDTDAKEFVERLHRTIADPRITILDLPDPLPPPIEASSTEHPFFAVVDEVMAQELPGGTSVPYQATGGSDSEPFRQIGIPAYGYFPGLLDPELVETIHGRDERIPLEELERGVRVTYRVLKKMITQPAD